jgi:hypothetical protein
MSRQDYRPLNVRDALSYLDKVKVSYRFCNFGSGPSGCEWAVYLSLAACICNASDDCRWSRESIVMSRVVLTFEIQFVDKPDVYNRFLDVMKEFKSQV